MPHHRVAGGTRRVRGMADRRNPGREVSGEELYPWGWRIAGTWGAKGHERAETFGGASALDYEGRGSGLQTHMGESGTPDPRARGPTGAPDGASAGGCGSYEVGSGSVYLCLALGEPDLATASPAATWGSSKLQGASEIRCSIDRLTLPYHV